MGKKENNERHGAMEGFMSPSHCHGCNFPLFLVQSVANQLLDSMSDSNLGNFVPFVR